MVATDKLTLKTVVIGSGLAGLSAACVAAARGHQVTLLEKNDWIGGKAAQHEAEGYRFDMGPTILTLPSVLRRVFAEAGRNMDSYLRLLPIDPQWRCFFDDHSVLDLVSDTAAMRKNLDRFTGSTADGIGYERFMGISQRLHDISDRFFFWRSVGGFSDTMQIGGVSSPAVLKDVWNLRMGRSVAGVVRSHVADSRVAQMMDHFTQYVGSAPDASPAVLCSIAHMQTDEGIWYPVGGMRALPVALLRLAEELGVEIRTGVDVTRIGIVGNRVAAVETSANESIECDAVISNCDAVRTYKDLIGGRSGERFMRRSTYEPACSGVVLYLGLNRRYNQLLHHNFVFSRDPEEEFRHIYLEGEPAPDPTAYVCAPSVSEPDVAPPDCEALYVLVHTPYLRPHHDWTRMLPEYREAILEKLERTAGMEDLRGAIRYEASLTPQGIHDRYRVLNGAIYGLASHGKFLGAFKPANRRKDVDGLYLAGGAAHPGPGMPMVLMSGWIAADALDTDAQAGRLVTNE